MQKTATVAVVNQDKKVLILRRGPTAPWMPGRYCLPGGKAELNEDLISCAARELGEETGIHIVDTNYFSPLTVNYNSGYNKIIFSVSINNPVVSLNWEHDDYKWVSTEESRLVSLVPGLGTTIKTLAHQGYVI